MILEHQIWSIELLTLAIPYKKFETIAQQVQDLARSGYWLAPCSLMVSPRVCLVDGVRYDRKLPLALFVYQPVRRVGKELCVGAPPLSLAELARLKYLRYDWIRVKAVAPHLSKREIEAAYEWIARVEAAIKERLVFDYRLKERALANGMIFSARTSEEDVRKIHQAEFDRLDRMKALLDRN